MARKSRKKIDKDPVIVREKIMLVSISGYQLRIMVMEMMIRF